MATIDFDSSDAREASRPPISLHPAFPAIVALWFAALLGLGSMVLPVVLLERLVGITGISSLVPAANPPLGFMARGLIALASGIAGAAIGVAIARHVARAHDSARPSRIAKFASGARRPISVNEELGGEPLINGHGLPVNRRRALAIAEDERPSDFLYMAPLPGDDQGEPVAVFEERTEFRDRSDEPLELGDAFEDSGEVDAAEFPAAYPVAASDEDESMTFKQEFQPTSPGPPAASARQEFLAGPDDAEVEPLPFSAPSLARRAALPEPEAPAFAPEQAPLELVPAAAEPQPVRGDWHVALVGELGLMQLVQRLSASLERRREWLASAPAAASAPFVAPAAGFDPAPPEEAALAMAEFFGKPAGEAAVSPAASGGQPAAANPGYRPAFPGAWQTNEVDDDLDALPSFTLPLRKAVSPTIAFDEPRVPEGPDDDRDTDDSYSSLLEMRNPFTPKDQAFVRIDVPEPDEGVAPAVVFPAGRGGSTFAASANLEVTSRPFDAPAGSAARPEGALQTAPANTDVALRAALATLQRMSGTA